MIGLQETASTKCTWKVTKCRTNAKRWFETAVWCRPRTLPNSDSSANHPPRCTFPTSSIRSEPTWLISFLLVMLSSFHSLAESKRISLPQPVLLRITFLLFFAFLDNRFSGFRPFINFFPNLSALQIGWQLVAVFRIELFISEPFSQIENIFFFVYLFNCDSKVAVGRFSCGVRNFIGRLIRF